MKQFFNQEDDFEDFLSNAADEHRMYPSDRLWRNIDSKLHEPKKWPALGFAAILLGAIISTGLLLVNPRKDLFTLSGTLKPATTETGMAVAGTQGKNPLLPQSPKKSSFQNTIFTFGASIMDDYNDERPDSELSATSLGILSSKTQPTANLAIESFQRKPDQEIPGYISPALLNAWPPESNIFSHEFPSLNSDLAEIPAPAETKESMSLDKNEAAGKPEKYQSQEIRKSKAQDLRKKSNKWHLQIYGTPSISYRFITEKKDKDIHFNNGAPLAPNYTGLAENFMRQRPSIGFEAGSAILYSVTDRFKLKMGLQVNFRQYAIDAFNAPSQPSALVLNYASGTDTLHGSSTLNSNNPVGRSLTVNNRLWQAAIPIGFELKLIHTKNIKAFVSGSLQPTYQFNTNIYLLSNDYKNYIQQTDIVRRFNVNTAIEAFVSFKAGGLTWQAGPQIRYQVLPTVNSAYPIHENLIDYGFKVGVVKSLK